MEKNSDDSSELLRQKRTEFAVEIRKKNKEKIMNNKRFRLLEGKKPSDFQFISDKDDSHIKKIVDDFLVSINQKNIIGTVAATVEIKSSLSYPQVTPESFVLYYIDKGIVKYLIGFLDRVYCIYPELQNEAAWALCNVTAMTSEACDYCLSNGILENILKALDFAEEDFFDNCLWTLANLAGDKLETRNKLLTIGLVDQLAKSITENLDKTLRTRISIWLISNLACLKPHPQLEYFAKALPLIGRMLLSKDTDTVEYCLWSLYYLTEDASNDDLRCISDLGITSKVFELLENKKTLDIRMLSLRFLGNFSMGDSRNISEIIDVGFLDYAIENFDTLKKRSRIDILWTLSNICADGIEAIQRVLATELPDILMTVVSEDEEDDLRIEGMHCVKNMVTLATQDQIQTLVSKNVIESILVNLESHHNPKLIEITLETLSKILHFGDLITRLNGRIKLNPYAKRVYESPYGMYVEMLQDHQNEKVYDLAHELIETFFNPLIKQSESDLMMKE